jgi:CBS domain-containing protein
MGKTDGTRNGLPTVGDLMSRDPISIPVDAPLMRAERILRECGISGLPVVDERLAEGFDAAKSARRPGSSR